MKTLFRTALLFAVSGALWACGADEGERAHEDGAAHTHEAEATVAEEGSAEGHAHGADTHAHDAPETEAFYGDEAATEEPSENDEHAHGDKTHSHTEPDPEHAADEAGESHQD